MKPSLPSNSNVLLKPSLPSNSNVLLSLNLPLRPRLLLNPSLLRSPQLMENLFNLNPLSAMKPQVRAKSRPGLDATSWRLLQSLSLKSEPSQAQT
jgi:hypothetical protein